MKKAKISKKDIYLRVPRLRGTTALAQAYTQEPNPQKQQQIRNRIKKMYLDHYSINQMSIGGEYWSLEKMAVWLNISTIEVMRELSREIGRIGGLLEGKDGKAYARALLSTLIFRSLESQSLIANQVHILTSQQGQEYVPFLTSELNKILATNNQATKATVDILKLMLDGNPGINITNINGQLNGTENNYLTVDSATTLIKSQGYQSLLENPTQLDAKLDALNDQNQLPEIRAQYQDLNAIGIKTPNKTLDKKVPKTIPNPDDYIEPE